MTVKPIEYPAWWKGRRMHFLEGAPFIGTQNRIIKCANQCLSLRNEVDFAELWRERMLDVCYCREVCLKIQKILAIYIPWINELFIPDDRVDIIFGNISGVGYDVEDPLKEIAREFNLIGTVFPTFVDFWEFVVDANMHDFILATLVVLKSDRLKQNDQSPAKPDHD